MSIKTSPSLPSGSYWGAFFLCCGASKPSQNSISFSAAIVKSPACAGDRNPPHFTIHFLVSWCCDILGVEFQMPAYSRRIYRGVKVKWRDFGISTSLMGVVQHVAPCSALTLTSSKSEVCWLVRVVKYFSNFAWFSSPAAGILWGRLRRGTGFSAGTAPVAKSRSLFHSYSGTGGNTLLRVVCQCSFAIDFRRFNGTLRPQVFSSGTFGDRRRIGSCPDSASRLDCWLLISAINFESLANLGGISLGGLSPSRWMAPSKAARSSGMVLSSVFMRSAINKRLLFPMRPYVRSRARFRSVELPCPARSSCFAAFLAHAIFVRLWYLLIKLSEDSPFCFARFRILVDTERNRYTTKSWRYWRAAASGR